MFQIWISYFHKKKCLRAAQEMHRCRQLKLYLQAWIFGVAQCKLRKKAEDVVMVHLFKKFVRTAFLGWQDVGAMARHVRMNQLIAANKIRFCRMTNAFTKWRGFVTSINLINNLVNTFAQGHMRKIYMNWLKIAKQQQNLQQSYSSIVSMRQHTSIRKILHIWQYGALSQRNKKEGAHKAAIYRHRTLTEKAFKILKKWMCNRQMKEGFSLLARGKLQQICMRWTFNVWLKQTIIWSKRRVALHQLQKTWEKHIVAKTFTELQIHTNENWHLRRMAMDAFIQHHEATMLENAESWHQQRCSHFVMQDWRTCTILSISLRQREHGFKLQKLQRQFKMWRTHLIYKQELKTIGRTLSLYHCNFLMKQCWQHWLACAEEAQYQQQFFVFKTFRVWIKYTKWKAFWRCMVQDAMIMIMQSLQKRVMWAWYSLVREIAVRREEHQQQRFLQREAMVLATRTERQQKTEIMSAFFFAWKIKLQQAITLSSSIEKWKHHLKQHVWLAWLHLVGQSLQGKKLRLLWLQAFLRRFLNAWHQATDEHVKDRKIREIQATGFSFWKCKRRVWLQWMSFVYFCKERVKVLKNCFNLLQAGQFWNMIREMLHLWRNYTLEREKKREHYWVAEASYKRHKLADYLAAWHHYTASSKDLAASLQGTIQVYKRMESSPLRQNPGLRYSLRHDFAHFPHYGNGDMSLHKLLSPSIIIEEITPPMEEGNSLFPFPFPSTPALLECHEDKPISGSGNLHVLENGSILNQDSVFQVEDGIESWAFSDNEFTWMIQ